MKPLPNKPNPFHITDPLPRSVHVLCGLLGMKLYQVNL